MEDHWTNGEPVPPMPDAAILLGDMNNAPGSPVYDEFVGPIGMESGRVQTLDRFVDPWTWLGNEENSGATSHFGELRIDHILITPNLRSCIRSMHIDNDATGSDHKPVWLELGETAKGC